MIKKIIQKIVHIFVGSKRFITVQLNDRIGPIDRGLTYEDPLDDFLKRNAYGQVVGGGTFQNKSGEIVGCDIQIELSSNGNNKPSIHNILDMFVELGAPKGSKLIFEDSQKEIEFGHLEGIAIYIDGKNLPESVYAESDINYVIAELNQILGYNGIASRNWQSSEWTALYYYGESFSEMTKRIDAFLKTYPLCEGAKVEQIS